MGSVSLAVRWTLGRSGRVTLLSDAEAYGLFVVARQCACFLTVPIPSFWLFLLFVSVAYDSTHKLTNSVLSESIGEGKGSKIA
jgi:hypothetical protein